MNGQMVRMQSSYFLYFEPMTQEPRLHGIKYLAHRELIGFVNSGR